VGDVQRDEAEVVALAETGALLDGLPVEEPLDGEGGGRRRGSETGMMRASKWARCPSLTCTDLGEEVNTGDWAVVSSTVSLLLDFVSRYWN